MNRFKKILTGVRNKDGSTIVGVLAALVFIGIVVGMMVKNTGSQSAASLGYAMPLVMQSTVNSGIMATDGYFLKNSGGDALKVIDKIAKGDAGTGTYIYGSASQRRALSASAGQYFSSKVDGAYQNNLTTTGGNLKAGFKVVAGKNARGKDMKIGRVFYQFGNLKKPTVAGTSGAKNAIFSTGGIKDANAAMNVTEGPATFMDSITFQNAESVFEKSAYFGKAATFNTYDVHFKDTVLFDNPSSKVTFSENATFDSIVVFRGPVEFKNAATFNDKVYFWNSAKFGNAAASFAGETYFGGAVTFSQAATFSGNTYFAASNETVKFGNAAVTFNAVARFNGTVEIEKAEFKNDVYFAGTAQFENGPVKFTGRAGFDGSIQSNSTLESLSEDVYVNANITNKGIEGSDKTGHNAYYNSTKITNPNSVFTKITPSASSDLSASSNSALGKVVDKNAALNVPTNIPQQILKDRKDPELDKIQAIYDVSKSNGGTVKIYNAEEELGNQFDMGKLRTLYATAEQNPSTLYLGKFMVIEITTGIKVSAEKEKFDANIIYIIKDGGTLDGGAGGFYSNTSDNATTSTLIYVGTGSAKLEQFGTKYTFRGFIYIDKGNTTTDNGLNFHSSGEAKIIGAVHNFSSNKLKWNTGKPEYSIPIEFNSDVLNAFASLYSGAKPIGDGTLGDGDVSLLDGTGGKGIEVKPLGIYFP
ncbi:hypothetical protein R80B4_01980 [Fibrobacteres bacterium R8-0-B4]